MTPSRRNAVIVDLLPGYFGFRAVVVTILLYRSTDQFPPVGRRYVGRGTYDYVGAAKMVVVNLMVIRKAGLDVVLKRILEAAAPEIGTWQPNYQLQVGKTTRKGAFVWMYLPR